RLDAASGALGRELLTRPDGFRERAGAHTAAPLAEPLPYQRGEQAEEQTLSPKIDEALCAGQPDSAGGHIQDERAKRRVEGLGPRARAVLRREGAVEPARERPHHEGSLRERRATGRRRAEHPS